MKRLILLLLLALLCAPIASAEPEVEVQARLNLSEDPLPFGKPAECIVTLTWPATVTFEPPQAEEVDIPEATTIDKYRVDLGTDGVKQQVEYHLIFTRFEPGQFTVGPITVTSFLQTDELSLEFSGSTPLEGDVEGEIRGPKKEAELSTLDFWLWLAKWIAGMLLTLLLLYLLINRSGLLDRFRSPRSLALKELSRLAKRRDLEPAQQLLACVEILRTYLDRAYSVTAHQSTAGEIVNQMTLDNRCRNIQGPAVELLQRGDLVKFAQSEVQRSESEKVREDLITVLKTEGKVPPK